MSKEKIFSSGLAAITTAATIHSIVANSGVEQNRGSFLQNSKNLSLDSIFTLSVASGLLFSGLQLAILGLCKAERYFKTTEDEKTREQKFQTYLNYRYSEDDIKSLTKARPLTPEEVEKVAKLISITNDSSISNALIHRTIIAPEEKERLTKEMNGDLLFQGLYSLFYKDAIEKFNDEMPKEVKIAKESEPAPEKFAEATTFIARNGRISEEDSTATVVTLLTNLQQQRPALFARVINTLQSAAQDNGAGIGR